MGSEMGPPSSLGTTSYRLPILTIGLSLTVFAYPGGNRKINMPCIGRVVRFPTFLFC